MNKNFKPKAYIFPFEIINIRYDHYGFLNKAGMIIYTYNAYSDLITYYEKNGNMDFIIPKEDVILNYTDWESISRYNRDGSFSIDYVKELIYEDYKKREKSNYE